MVAQPGVHLPVVEARDYAQPELDVPARALDDAEQLVVGRSLVFRIDDKALQKAGLPAFGLEYRLEHQRIIEVTPELLVPPSWGSTAPCGDVAPPVIDGTRGRLLRRPPERKKIGDIVKHAFD
jgi:hypothetical protein